MEEMFYLHELDGIEDLPEKVYIEPTSMCNLNCSICFRHGWINEKLGKMELDTFHRVIESIKDMPTVKEVFFGGMGEPLFHQKICDMMEMIPSNIKKSLLTNGTMLKESCAKGLIEAGLSELWVSMDGFDEESYKLIQRGGQFNEIKNNLLKFNEYRQDKDVKLGITFVVAPENLEQLHYINQFADEVKADFLNISHMITGEPTKQEDMLYDREDIPVGKMHRFVPKANETQEHVCPFVQNNAVFVRWDGGIYPCMQLLHSCYTYLYEEKRKITSVSYGNIKEDTLLNIWNSPDYTAFRMRVRTFYFPFCRICFGCEDRKENLQDCFLGEAPTCGACLWATGKVFCP